MKKIILGNAQISVLAGDVARVIASCNQPYKQAILLYGIPRGGIPSALAVAAALAQHNIPAILVDDPLEANYFIDDIIDSGQTMQLYCDEYPGIPFLSLIGEADEEAWYIFPWEVSNEQEYSATDIPVRLLQFIGEDVTRGGLKETPERFLRAWQFWTSGYDQDASDILKVFEDGAEDYNEIILVKNIPVYSQCEHHLAPFFGIAHVAYIPNGRIVGLSKLNRLVDMYARRLQVQERLTRQIAEAIDTHLAPEGVAVILECRHLCMESRGVCQQGHSTTTSAMRGIFMTDSAARAELLQLRTV